MTSKTSSILIGVLVYVFVGIILQLVAAGAGVLNSVLGCLVILGSAMVAVWHFTSNNSVTLPAGEGAGMGALVGLFGAILAGLLSFLLISAGAMPDPADLALEQMRGQGMTEEELEEARGMTELFSSPLMVLLVGSVIGAIVGAIGGAIGAAVFKKGDGAPAEPGF